MNQSNRANMTTRMPLIGNRSFVVLITAQIISNIGDWLHILALFTLVGFKWNATPWEITIFSLCMAIPMMIGGPIVGGALVTAYGADLAFIVSGSLMFILV